MKKVLLLAFLAFSMNVFAQIRPAVNLAESNPLPKYDSMYFWKWDSINGTGWLPYMMYKEFVYDSINHISSVVMQTRVGSVWVNTTKKVSTSDANNNLLQVLYMSWDSSNWVNNSKDEYTYDGNNHQTSYTHYQWDTGSWINYRHYIYTWDSDNNQTSILLSDWNGSTWLDNKRDTCTYDGNHNMLTRVEQYIVSGSPLNYQNTIYIYDAANNLTMKLIQRWQVGWIDYLRYQYTYDANNNPLTEIIQEAGFSWSNYQKRVLTYDVNNNKTLEILQVWGADGWESISQEVFSYDSRNNLLQQTSQEWFDFWRTTREYTITWDANNFEKSYTYKWFSPPNTNVIMGDSAHYYFYSVMGINEMNSQADGISVFPNPCKGTFTVSSLTPLTRIEVYDLRGEKVCTASPLRNNFTLDISTQPKGTYMVKMSRGGDRWIRKIFRQ